MSDIIQLLPDSVANQIAAGEVIQRPASVIKELVENAVDAKASSIQVILKDAGRTLIQVIDNGKGMSATDARLAFERHATSKIKVADDLFSLHTMGFRGEALASIAAIAQVELRTKRKEDEMGTLITLAASTVESQECVSCPTGSNFCVKNIFYNVPARRKFLKSNQVELSNIINEFERIALINPEVSFILKHNDNELFNLQPGNFRQRIVSIYGKGMNQQLLPLEIETSLIKISGYIGKPEAARKRNALQYFFVNGRYMRHPYFHKAVMQSYEQLIPVGEMPNYFINFTVEPSQIDVNIHPTKTEIKFENEQAIWQIISATVKEALGKFSAVPSIDFDMTDAPDIPIFQKNNPVAPPKSNFNPSYNPFKMSTGGNSRRPDFDWNKLYAGFTSGQVPVAGKEEESEIFASAIDREDDELSEESLIVQSVISTDNMGDTGGSFMQIRGRYILTNVKSGLMIVDQYRAHVRILFDRYMSCIQAKQGVSQRTLFPEIIQLTTAQVAILQNIMADLQFLGFDLSDMGNNAYSVNGIPSGIEGVNIETLIWNMLETATEKGRDVKADIHERLALSLAEAAAIPYGQVLSSLEMEQLVGDLLASVMPNYTPDGKTVISILSNDEITKRFK
ncbi:MULTISPECIES: DNA mismatch repair endonuclease MutL [Bacteroidales]|jgi:DNA mismatch repair protein mutL|uniref:DNA mismatch repair endonuclease MutL n=1 Tax=Bacteroidales TaxID=171549 RepID=UPI0005754383|nr:MULTISPECIES: DNA mismatch repair endonuclease MutL [Bacteroidales]KHM45702.1 DNA mismatch repair protein MutL [Coprobacter secundus]